MSGEANAGSGRDFRLDPCTLPIRSASGKAGGGDAVFYLDTEQAVLRRDGGRSTTAVTVPMADYDGVSVRIASVDPDVRLALDLLHTDPSLVLPLALGQETDDMADDWEAWGRVLGLPLLVISPDGTIARFEQLRDRLSFGAVKPRRRQANFVARRPRFLTRRKTGRTGPTERLSFREIIART